MIRCGESESGLNFFYHLDILISRILAFIKILENVSCKMRLFCLTNTMHDGNSSIRNYL